MNAVMALRWNETESLAYHTDLTLAVDQNDIMQRLGSKLEAQLSESDRAVLESLRKALEAKGESTIRAIEKTYAEEGYLLPAILILVVVVALYVYVV